MRCPILNYLPVPPSGKTGWPWTEESPQLLNIMSNSRPWPKISIVTPSYNQGQFIEETIRSVLLQGYPNLEYIIIDGNSTDNSIEIIKKYQKYLTCFITEADRGPSDAIRKGWNKATGEIVAYLNSDDAYTPGALACVSQAFAQDAKSIAICGNEFTIDKEGFILSKSDIKVVNYLTLLKCNWVSQPATFIYKSSLDSVGGMNQEIKYTFDLELLLRIARFGSIKCIPERLAVTRWHDNTITFTQRSKIADELVRIFEATITDYPLKLTKKEKWQMLCRINQIAMGSYLIQKNFLGSLRYAMRALYYTSSLMEKVKSILYYARVCYGTGKFYFGKLFSNTQTLSHKRILDKNTNKPIHWSRFFNNPVKSPKVKL